MTNPPAAKPQAADAVRQFCWYLAIGCGVFAVDFGLFMLLAQGLGLTVWLANMAAKIAGGVLSFLMHRRITFSAAAPTDWKAPAMRYAMALVFNLMVFGLAFDAILGQLPYVPVARLMVDALCIATTFAILKFLVFTPANKP